MSVLIPTWNRAPFLRTAIDSVLSQDFGDLEVIVSDNASTDDTPSLVKGYAERDRRVRYFRNPANVGATRNMNLCYRRSDPSSKYWVLLPSDDWWDPKFLATVVSAAEANPTAAVIHGDAFRTEADGRIINRYSEMWQSLPPVGLHHGLPELFQGNYLCAPATLFNRGQVQAVLSRAEVLDTDLAYIPDYDLYLQLFCRGSRACYVPDSLVYFRKHEGALTMPVNTVPRLREEIRVLQRLEGICPPGFEAERRVAIQTRLAGLGFELLGIGAADEARIPLGLAHRAGRRLDVAVARAISALPLPSPQRSRLWRVALATSVAARGTR